MSGKKPREIAAQILANRADGEFVETLLHRSFRANSLSIADRSLCQELVYGVVRWQATLDWLIKRKTSDRVQKPLLSILLRLGLYQIFWLDRIPDHAAVHETVELAKNNGLKSQAGFVNAVLRGYLRESEATRKILRELKVKDASVGYSHPKWVADRWQQRWGVEKAARLMEWNNQPPKTVARINTLKTDAEKLLRQWRDENVESEPVSRDWIENNLVFELKSHPPIDELPSFQQGGFYVQDPSTLLAVSVLNPQKGESVLDLCAAPGGKFTCIAQQMGNVGRLVAYDSSSERLKVLKENCERLGVNYETANQKGNELFDRVLVDAPCSNTGVMRRRVDLRWRIREEEIERLRAAQVGLLKQAAACLKPHGTLVYSTCSLEPEENRQVVDEFLRAERELQLESDRELLPFNDETDGAYVALLRRS